MWNFQIVSLAALVATWLLASVAHADATSVQQLLTDRCVLCHQGDAAPLGLKLDSLKDLMAGSNNGPVVIAGDPGASEIILRIRGVKEPRMPMTGPPWLTNSEEALLSGWILEGANVSTTKTPDAAELIADSPGERSKDLSNEDSKQIVDIVKSPLDTDQTFVTYLNVAPIFARSCTKCHSKQGVMGAAPEGYELTSHKATLAASERARVVPGNPAASELLRRISGLAVPQMPFDGPPYLSDTEIRLIERWIQDGARDSEGQKSLVPIGAEVRIEGNLKLNNQIDNIRFKVNASTRIEKDPRLGERVELRARVDSEGKLVATRLRRR